MCEWKPDFDKLDERVDSIDQRLTAVEQTIATMHGEITTGFADMKAELGRIYAERAAWSAWAREHIGNALKWAGAIILAACGITQIDKIVGIFR